MTLKLKRLLFPNKEQERGTNWQVLHVAAVHCSEDHGTVCPSIQIIQSEVPHQRRSRVNKQVHTVQRERERAQSLDQDNMLGAGIEPDAQAYWEKHLVDIAEKAQGRSFHVTCFHPF